MRPSLSLLLTLLLSLGLVFLVLATAGAVSSQAGQTAPIPGLEAQERAASKMDEELLAQLGSAPPDSSLPVIVRLGQQADLNGVANTANRAARGAQVYQALQQAATTSQRDIRSYLDGAMRDGRVAHYRPYFIFNGLAVTATPETIWQLALRDDVESVTADHVYYLDGQEESGEWGVGSGERGAESGERYLFNLHSLIPDPRSPAPSYQLPVTSYQLPVTSHQPPPNGTLPKSTPTTSGTNTASPAAVCWSLTWIAVCNTATRRW